jgi:NAD(P)H dehydrogenase (quinone)
MPKILIVYDSRTGNTEKMALAVAQGAKKVKGTAVDVIKTDKASLEDLKKADGIIVGSPTYCGGMSGKLKKFIDESVKIHGELAGKVGAAFTSSGGIASGAETTCISILQALLIHGMIIQGRADHKHYGAAVVRGPGKEGVDDCGDLGRQVAELVKKIRR